MNLTITEHTYDHRSNISRFSRELGWLSVQPFTRKHEVLCFADLLGLILFIGSRLTMENHGGSPS